MKKLLILCTCLVLTFIINAQTIDKKWNVGLHAGISQYNGDLGNTFYTSNLSYGLGGISVSRYIVGNFDLNLLVTKGTVGYNEEGDMGNFKSGFTSALLNFRFNILGPQSFIRPYLFVGAGAMLFDKDLTITEDKVDYIAPSFGGGINIKLGQYVMLNLQETFLYSTSDVRD
jgi:OmpA-OmpF porin, OOP family